MFFHVNIELQGENMGFKGF